MSDDPDTVAYWIKQHDELAAEHNTLKFWHREAKADLAAALARAERLEAEVRRCAKRCCSPYLTAKCDAAIADNAAG
jgi:hypothetical protein